MIPYMITCPAEACKASENGILLWFHQVLPALLPFTMISAIVMRSGFLPFAEEHLPAFFAKFGVTRLSVIFCGFLFGFPIGSKLSCDCYNAGLITKKDAQLLCTFTNNLSPAFLLSYMLHFHLKNVYSAPVTLGILYLPPLLTGCFLLFRTSASARKKSTKKTSRFQMDMQIVDAGIISGFETLIKLCGYIVFFSMLGSMISALPILSPAIRLFLCACLEVTNGIAIIAGSALSPLMKYIACIGLSAAGGLSGIAQTASMLSQTDLSLSSYIRMKLFFTTCSVCLAAASQTLFV